MSASYSHRLSSLPRAPRQRTVIVNTSSNLKKKECLKGGPDPSYEIIKITDTPKTDKWAFEPMFKRSLTEADIFWVVGFDPEEEVIVRWFGQINGKVQTPTKKVEENMSGRNIQEQALLEARQLYKKKHRNGYLPAGATEPPMIKVMTAMEYKPEKPYTKRCFVDAKLDGVRAWTRMVGENVEMMSRGSIVWKNMEHIERRCARLFEYLPAHSILDGEMFHPDLKFETKNGITSICRTESKHPMMNMMEYHVFDVWWEENPPFEERRAVLEKAIKLFYKDEYGWEQGPMDFNEEECPKTYRSGGRPKDLIDPALPADYYANPELDDDRFPKIFAVELHEARSPEEIDSIYEYFLDRNFEGAMIKRLANGARNGTNDYKMSQYLFGKGSRVYKYKPATTEEGRCVGVSEGVGTMEGCALLDVIDCRGNQLRLGVGCHDQRRHWFKHPEEVIGKAVTFKYGKLSAYNVPIFAVGVAVRDYEPGHDGLDIPTEDLNKPKRVIALPQGRNVKTGGSGGLRLKQRTRARIIVGE